MKDSPGARGAYGFRLEGLDSPLLVPCDPDWPALTIERRVGLAAHERESVSGERAELILRNGGGIVVERTPSRAAISVPFELTDDELVHPYLAPAASVAARWLGRESFHAGGAVLAGGVWGVLGEREAGKSSLLAWLAHEGHGIASDDVLVTDGASAFAGPRSIDLREEAAERLRAGTSLGVVGARERWRVVVDTVPAELPLRGWVLLEWGDAVEARRLPAAECLQRIAALRAVRVPPSDPGLLLRLAGLPAWELRRPRSWDALPRATEALRRALGASGDRATRTGAA